MLVLLALLATAPAHAAREITLTEALAAVGDHPTLRVAQATRDGTDAGLRLARSGYDPVFSAGTALDSSDSQGYLAGYPTSSTATGWSSDAGLGAITPFGTTWSVSAALDRSKTTSTLALGGTPTTQEVDTWGAAVGVTVGQDLLAPFRSTPEAVTVRQALERLDQADVSVLQARQAALADVAAAWWAWSAAVDGAAIAERSLAQSEALEARTRAWRDEGVLASLELDRVTADLLGARRDLLVARAEVRRTADALLVLIGGTPGEDVAPAGDPTWPATESLDVVLHTEVALAGNLDVALARLELAAATASERDARHTGLPSIALAASAQLGTLSDTASDAITRLATDDAFPSLGVGVDLSVPLGGRAARAQRDQADATVYVEEIQLADTELRVTASTRAAVDGVATARAGAELAAARLAVAVRTEEGEQARVDEGVKRLDELLVAQDARVAAELDVVRAERDLASAELELARLEGRLALLGVP